MAQPTNDFTEGQKAIIRNVSFEVGEVIAKRIAEKLDEQIKAHAKGCEIARLKASRNDLATWGDRVWKIAVSLALIIFGWWLRK